MKKQAIVEKILGARLHQSPAVQTVSVFSPVNIALIKYWGKRDVELNLPVTNSFSLALPTWGAHTTMTVSEQDELILNGKIIEQESDFYQRASLFLNLFRKPAVLPLKIEIKMNVPVGAGLASSAAGFSSLLLALNELFSWNLTRKELSILSRLGSGSASRSLWMGFVEWRAGVQADGMDSYAEPISGYWEDLCVGLHIVNASEKKLSSREAMQRTVDGSVLYGAWPKKVAHDLTMIKQAMQMKSFSLFGGIAESNALTMHATMLSAWPPVCYFDPETIASMKKVWALREQGMSIFFTQDAGPNLKLLFLNQDAEVIQKEFPGLIVIKPFDY